MLESHLQRLRIVKPKYIVWMLIIFYTGFFSWFTILEHHTFQTYAGDLGYFDQAFWATLQGRPLYISLWDDIGTTTLAHHFQLIMFLILPIYTIYQSPETLLVLQSFFLALGALPIYWISEGCAQLFLFVFVTVFHGEFAGASHGALSSRVCCHYFMCLVASSSIDSPF